MCKKCFEVGAGFLCQRRHAQKWFEWVAVFLKSGGGDDKKMFRVGGGKSEAALVKNVLSCGGWFFKSEGPWVKKSYLNAFIWILTLRTLVIIYADNATVYRCTPKNLEDQNLIAHLPSDPDQMTQWGKDSLVKFNTAKN